MLPKSDRKDLAIQALARSTTINDLSVRHGVSRKFVYQQARKAGAALDEIFLPGTPEDDVLFHLTVSKTWLRQVIVALTLVCRSSYRGVVEFLRDLLGVPISIGTVHHVLQSATRQAGIVNRAQDLSGIVVGLHDEIFQGTVPVLAGVDAASTYCYLLAVAEHRDADTWGVHLLDASQQGLKPDYTIADAGQGFARWAKGRLGRYTVPRRCVSHHASIRRARQHAVAPRQGRPVAVREAGGQDWPHGSAWSGRRTGR